MIDTNHQDRINYQILADCYDEYEQGQAWTLYLVDNITCPFTAKYTGSSKLSITANILVTVLELMNSEYDSEEDFECFMAMVEVEVGDVIYEIPLADLKVVEANEKTEQAVADWKYYINNC
ncbi:MAG: hypothetical protein IBX55_12510 [Methyloprofundus sp.]|nr:hypothetical protein [Methyloprofundus sp.]MBW6454039.1 calcium-binding protein [Methyloprofundus sp.]